MKTTDYKAIRYTVFLLIIIVFSYNNVIGQYDKEKGYEYYKKGLEKFNQNKYKEADSLFKISISISHETSPLYYISIINKYLNNKCEYCNYLNNVDVQNYTYKEKLYDRDCKKYDKIFYKTPEKIDSTDEYIMSNIYTVISKEICSGKKQAIIYDINDINIYNSITCFTNNDSIIKKLYDINFEISTYYYKNRISGLINCIDEKPEFIGGNLALQDYIKNNLNYPEEAKKGGISGIINVEFVINEVGKIENTRVINNIHPLLDAEAVRVIKNMPQWIPGTTSCVPARIVYRLPINFALN